MRKRWLDDAVRIKNGKVPEPLPLSSSADTRAAASQWVVHAANDDKISFELNDWNFLYHAEEKQFLLLCTDAFGKKAFYAWSFDFEMLHGC